MALDPGFVQALAESQGAVSLENGGRVAFTWTSTLRRLRALGGDLAALAKDDLALASQSTVIKNRNLLEALTTPRSEMTYIRMLVNPSTMQIDRPKRIARLDTLGGTRWLHFTDKRGSNTDVMTISLAGSTGTISVRDGQDEATVGLIKRRLLLWNNLYRLSLEPPYVPGLNGIIKNEIRLQVASQTFPMPFDFIGYFPNDIKWGEDGDRPNSVNYSIDFVVERTEPDYDTVLAAMGDIISSASI